MALAKNAGEALVPQVRYLERANAYHVKEGCHERNQAVPSGIIIAQWSYVGRSHLLQAVVMACTAVEPELVAKLKRLTRHGTNAWKGAKKAWNGSTSGTQFTPQTPATCLKIAKQSNNNWVRSVVYPSTLCSIVAGLASVSHDDISGAR